MGKTSQRNHVRVGVAIKKTISKIKTKLRREKIEVHQIVLFGSHAKGVADKHSDLDLCFVFNPKKYDEEDLLLLLTKAIIFEMRIIADIVVMTQQKYLKNKTSPLVHEIRSYGLVV